MTDEMDYSSRVVLLNMLYKIIDSQETLLEKLIILSDNLVRRLDYIEGMDEEMLKKHSVNKELCEYCQGQRNETDECLHCQDGNMFEVRKDLLLESYNKGVKDTKEKIKTFLDIQRRCYAETNQNQEVAELNMIIQQIDNIK